MICWLSFLISCICSILSSFALSMRWWSLSRFSFSISVSSGVWWKLARVSNSSFLSWVWQYRLWSFPKGGTKLERFLPKNQHIQRKLFNFKNWVIMGRCQKVSNFDFQSFYVKYDPNLSQFFSFQFRSTFLVIDIFR